MIGGRLDAVLPPRSAVSPLLNTRFSRTGGAVAVGLLAGVGAILAAPLALAPILAIAGVAAAPWPRPARLPPRPVFLWLTLSFLAWCGAALFWAPDAARGSGRFLAVMAIALGMFVFMSAADLSRDADRALAQRAVTAGALVALVSLAWDVTFGNLYFTRALLPEIPLQPQADVEPERTRIQLALSAFSIMLCGIGALSARRGWQGWGVAAALVLATAWLAWDSNDPVTVCAIGAAMLCGAVAFLRPEISLLWIGQLGALWLVAAPWLHVPAGAALARFSLDRLDPSLAFAWKTQLFTWRYVVGEIARQPLWGAGFDAARTMQGTQQIDGYILPVLAGDPGNFGLQIWLETGAVGVALAAGGLAALGRRLGALFARDRIAAAWTAAALAAGLIHANLDTGLWDGWFWASMVIAGAIIRLSRASD